MRIGQPVPIALHEARKVKSNERFMKEETVLINERGRKPFLDALV